jgi:hypothetical protein
MGNRWRTIFRTGSITATVEVTENETTGLHSWHCTDVTAGPLPVLNPMSGDCTNPGNSVIPSPDSQWELRDFDLHSSADELDPTKLGGEMYDNHGGTFPKGLFYYTRQKL